MDKWTGLTAEEVIDARDWANASGFTHGKFYEAIEALLKAKNANAAPQDQDAKPMVIGYFIRTTENGDSHYFSIPDTLPEGKYEIVLRAAMKEQKP